jgi:hypothetical protein
MYGKTYLMASDSMSLDNIPENKIKVKKVPTVAKVPNKTNVGVFFSPPSVSMNT